MNEEQLRAQLAAVYASKSWKVTAPLRACMGFLLRTRERLLHPRRTLGNGLRRLAYQPRIRRLGPFISLHFPALYVRLIRIVNAAPDTAAVVMAVPVSVASPAPMPVDIEADDPALSAMSASARRIYVALHAPRTMHH